jgi:hypothetical protein
LKKYCETAERDNSVDAAGASSDTTQSGGGRVTLEASAFAFTLGVADGLRAVTWEGRVVTLNRGPAWGLETGGPWDIYRWYPDPARLVREPEGFRGTARMAVAPASPAQPFAVHVTDLPGRSSWMNAGKDTSRGQRRFSAHFLP